MIALKRAGRVSLRIMPPLSAAAFIWSCTALWGVVDGLMIGGSIVVHELGHAVAIKALGYRLEGYGGIPFLGAFVLFDREGADVEHRRIIAQAGLLAGAVSALPWFLVGHHYPGYLMLGITAFNLLPFRPFDGGDVYAGRVTTPLLRAMTIGAVLFVTWGLWGMATGAKGGG